jgi:glycolate oxidase
MSDTLHVLREHFGDKLIQERPRSVVMARDAEDVLRLILLARQQSLRILVLGTGSSFSTNVSIPMDVVALMMSDFAKPMEWDNKNLTLTAPASVRIADLDDQLQSVGWEHRFLGGTNRVTLGGLIAGSHLGSSTVQNYNLRNFILGMKVAYSGGYMIQWGGKMVKDVAGLDLSSLILGSAGGIGVILEVIFRLVPFPSPLFDLEFANHTQIRGDLPAANPLDDYSMSIFRALDPHRIFYQPH